MKEERPSMRYLRVWHEERDGLGFCWWWLVVQC